MKNALPWILAVGLSAGLAAVFASGWAKDKELTRLRQENQDAQALHAQLDEAKTQVKTLQDEAAGLREERQELLRLRNEITKLRNDSQALEKKLTTAQSEAQRAQAQASQAVQSAQQSLTENQQLRTAASQGQAVIQRNACVGNLRQLATAKAQWGAEHNRAPNSVPTAQDLAQYANVSALTCPAGGAYSINSLGQVPTCSIAGHSMLVQ